MPFIIPIEELKPDIGDVVIDPVAGFIIPIEELKHLSFEKSKDKSDGFIIPIEELKQAWDMEHEGGCEDL